MAAETTAVARGAQRFGHKASHTGLVAHVFTQAYLSTDTQLNDVYEIGYIPAGVTVIGFCFVATDLDTGSPAVVQQILIGTTAVKSTITLAQGGGADFYPITPVTTTAATVFKIKTTTAAATGAAGTIYITPIYFSA